MTPQKLSADVTEPLALALTAVQSARTITGAGGLSGGGDLSANREISLSDDVAYRVGWLAPGDGADKIRDRVAASTAGDRVILPSGVFETSEPLILKGFRKYVGWGCKLKAANGANLDAVVTSEAATTTATTFDGPILLDGLNVDGNRDNQTGGAGDGIRLAVGQSLIHGCSVWYCRGNGIVLSDQNSAGTLLNNTQTAVENRIVDCEVFYVNGRGIFVYQNGANQVTDGFARGNVVGFCNLDGLRVDSAAGWMISENHVYAVGLSGIIARYPYATRINGNYIEGYGGLDSSASLVGMATGAWSAETTYAYRQVVTHAGLIYVSKVDGNINHQPNTSADQWGSYILGSNTVAGIMVPACQIGRDTRVYCNQISIGHSSYILRPEWTYRGIFGNGPESGSTKGALRAYDNMIANESQPAGTNTIAMRFATGTGGLNVVERDNEVVGNWTSRLSADAGTAPAVAAGAGAGTSPTVAITGHDRLFQVTVTTGTGASAGTLATVTLLRSRVAAPSAVVSPRSGIAAALEPFVSATATAVTLGCAGTPGDATTYVFDVIVP